MVENTKIEWTDHTFNPWTGCTRVSPGCDHCYAEAMSKRNPGTFGSWEPGAKRKRTSVAYWNQPHRWNRAAQARGKRMRVFCASMADIMDKAAPIEWFVDALDMMRVTPHLIWLLLTKRPQLIRRRLEEALAHLSKGTDRGDLIEWIAAWLHGRPPENIWLGTTVENQAEADRRIPHLLAVPAAKRFLSCEPLLGPVDLTNITGAEKSAQFGSPVHGWSCLWKGNCIGRPWIDWVIAGGESGPGFRPIEADWMRTLRDQCLHTDVAFFAKQMAGARKPLPPLPSDLAGCRAWPA